METEYVASIPAKATGEGILNWLKLRQRRFSSWFSSRNCHHPSIPNSSRMPITRSAAAAGSSRLVSICSSGASGAS
jgi:hypothetical protein